MFVPIFSDACLELVVCKMFCCELLILKTNYKMPAAVERMKANKNHGVSLLMNDNLDSGT